MGADKLLGNGDMLFLSPGTSTLLRGQGTYLSDDEITTVVDFVGTEDPQFATELLQLKTKEEQEAAAAGPAARPNRDDLYEAAVDVVLRERRGSVSLLQRCLGIGYGRAARLIDYMAEDGIVGEYNGSQARETLVTVEEWEAMLAGGEAPKAAEAEMDDTAHAAPWEDDSSTRDETEEAETDAEEEINEEIDEDEDQWEYEEEEDDSEADEPDAEAEYEEDESEEDESDGDSEAAEEDGEEGDGEEDEEEWEYEEEEDAEGDEEWEEEGEEEEPIAESA